MTPPRAIAIANRHPRLRLDRRAVARVIHTLDSHAALFRPKTARPVGRQSKIKNRKSKIHPGPRPGELSLVFLSDPALAKLHGDFLGDPTMTDVITFEGDPALGIAGEICISADAALRHVTSRRTAALARRRPAARSDGGDFSAELTLYVVHGWLHLAGYDDLVLEKKRAMRRAEVRALALLRASRILPHFALRPPRARK